MEVSTPNPARALLVKDPIEFAFKGKNGWTDDRNTFDPGGAFLDVSATYFCNNDHGHKFFWPGNVTMASHLALNQPLRRTST